MVDPHIFLFKKKGWRKKNAGIFQTCLSQKSGGFITRKVLILEITGGTPASASSRPAPVKPPWEWSRCVAPRQSHPLGQQPAKAGWVVDSLTDRMVFFLLKWVGGMIKFRAEMQAFHFFQMKGMIRFYRPKTSYLKRMGHNLTAFRCQVQHHPSELPVMAPVMAPVAILEQRWRLLSEAWQIWESEPLLACFLNLTKHTFIYKFSYIII